MSKFLLTGVLLVLLASFLHYSPTTPANDAGEMPTRNQISMFHISEQVKLARLERHISQKELANKVGLTRLDIEKIETARVVPTRDILYKIEQTLNTSLTMESY